MSSVRGHSEEVRLMWRRYGSRCPASSSSHPSEPGWPVGCHLQVTQLYCECHRGGVGMCPSRRHSSLGSRGLLIQSTRFRSFSMAFGHSEAEALQPGKKRLLLYISLPLLTIVVSSSLIRSNRFLMQPENFPFPFVLVVMHCIFCSLFALGLRCVQPNLFPAPRDM